MMRLIIEFRAYRRISCPRNQPGKWCLQHASPSRQSRSSKHLLRERPAIMVQLYETAVPPVSTLPAGGGGTPGSTKSSTS